MASPPPRWQCKILRKQARVDADLFVCQIPEKASEKIQLVVRLVGGSLITPDFLTSEGLRGVAIAFQPAMKTPRNVFVSEGFLQDRLYIAEDVFKVTQLAESKWVWLGSMAQVLDFLGPPGPRRDRKQRELVAFVTLADRDSEDTNRFRVNRCLGNHKRHLMHGRQVWARLAAT